MRPPVSLRARLFIGAVVWTIGLIALMNLVVSTLRIYSDSVVHLAGLSVAAAGLLVYGLVQIRSILAPFRRLQRRLIAVRDGREQRLEGRFPSEVAPLVADLNALLEHRERMVRRAAATAGDLAHGLKTPLAVLGQEGDRLTAAGHPEVGAIIGQQVERMRRQIDYHLAHARAAASGTDPGAASRVLEAVQGLSRTLSRLYAEKRLEIETDIEPAHRVRVHRQDLDEMLGNLLDNACKWARSRVVVASLEEQAGISVLVDDDGPGVPDAMRELVLRRGVRADEAAPGSGLGLAIVADLAELYGGAIALQASPLGGARARLTLPASSPGA